MKVSLIIKNAGNSKLLYSQQAGLLVCGYEAGIVDFLAVGLVAVCWCCGPASQLGLVGSFSAS